jgi:hypothetical protein
MCSGQSERTRISISGSQIMESGVQTFENGETIFCQQVKLAVIHRGNIQTIRWCPKPAHMRAASMEAMKMKAL